MSDEEQIEPEKTPLEIEKLEESANESMTFNRGFERPVTKFEAPDPWPEPKNDDKKDKE